MAGGWDRSTTPRMHSQRCRLRGSRCAVVEGVCPSHLRRGAPRGRGIRLMGCWVLGERVEVRRQPETDRTPAAWAAWTEALVRTRRDSGGCHGTGKFGCDPRLRPAPYPWLSAPPVVWSARTVDRSRLRRCRENQEAESARCRWRGASELFPWWPSSPSASTDHRASSTSGWVDSTDGSHIGCASTVGVRP